MSLASPTLLDLMTMLPDLHPMHLANTQIASIRELRLISKDIGRLALTTVTSCEVHLGSGGPVPDPLQLLRLMIGAQIKQLRVTLTVTSGPNAPTAANQLLDCIRQMNCLVNGLKQALHSTVSLTLTVFHHEWKLVSLNKHCVSCMQATGHPSIPQHSYLLLSACNAEATTPLETASSLSFGAVSGLVFKTLATAVKNVQHLSLCGRFTDAALPAFGTSCLNLSSLDLDADNVDPEAFYDVGRSLPNLDYVTLRSSNRDLSASQQLAAYVDDFSFAIKDCKRLTFLGFCFPEVITLACKPGTWQRLPGSLQSLHCTCSMETSVECISFLGKLTLLNFRSPWHDLLEFLHDLPDLEKLSVCEHPCSKPILLVCAESDALSQFKNRILTKSLQLQCPSLTFHGTCDEVASVLEWFPKEVHVWYVKLEFTGGVQTSCLQYLPTSFPELCSVCLSGWTEESDVQEMDVDLFRPLTACPNLSALQILSDDFILTTTGMAQLFASLPSSTSLTTSDPDFNLLQFSAELAAIRAQALL